MMTTPLNSDTTAPDSYVDLADAASFWGNVLGGDDWESYSERDKIRALRSAAQQLQCYQWCGCPVDMGQSLAWPRTHDSAGWSGTVPNEIKEAQIRIALKLLRSGGTSGANGTVKVSSVKFGDFSASFAGGGAVVDFSDPCNPNLSPSTEIDTIPNNIDCLVVPFLKPKPIGPRSRRVLR